MAEGKAMSEFLPFSRPAMGVEELAAVKEVLESGPQPVRRIRRLNKPFAS